MVWVLVFIQRWTCIPTHGGHFFIFDLCGVIFNLHVCRMPGVALQVKPVKIVAGLEPEQTNAFLQSLAKAASGDRQTRHDVTQKTRNQTAAHSLTNCATMHLTIQEEARQPRKRRSLRPKHPRRKPRRLPMTHQRESARNHPSLRRCDVSPPRTACALARVLGPTYAPVLVSTSWRQRTGTLARLAKRL